MGKGLLVCTHDCRPVLVIFNQIIEVDGPFVADHVEETCHLLQALYSGNESLEADKQVYATIWIPYVAPDGYQCVYEQLIIKN